MNIEQTVLQVQKLDKLLSLVRELPEDTLAVDKDGASSVSDSWKIKCVFFIRKKEETNLFIYWQSLNM